MAGCTRSLAVAWPVAQTLVSHLFNARHMMVTLCPCSPAAESFEAEKHYSVSNGYTSTLNTLHGLAILLATAALTLLIACRVEQLEASLSSSSCSSIPPDPRRILASPRLLPDPQAAPQQQATIIIPRQPAARQRSQLQQSRGGAAGAVVAAAAPAATAAGKVAALAAISKEEERLRQIIMGDVLEQTAAVAFEDVAGLQLAKQALQEAVILPS